MTLTLFVPLFFSLKHGSMCRPLEAGGTAILRKAISVRRSLPADAQGASLEPNNATGVAAALPTIALHLFPASGKGSRAGRGTGRDVEAHVLVACPPAKKPPSSPLTRPNSRLRTLNIWPLDIAEVLISTRKTSDEKSCRKPCPSANIVFVRVNLKLRHPTH